MANSLNKITTKSILDATVATADIAADAVTGAKIADDAVGAEHIEVLDAALQLADSVKIQVGTGNDLEIYHDGSNSILNNTTGHLDFHVDGTKKMRLSDGGDLQLDDSRKIELGSSQDLQLYHDGSNSYIVEGGTGNLFLRAQHLQIQGANGENMVYGNQDGSVELYHDAVKKISTKSDGIEIHAPEGGEAIIYQTADEGDDNADWWRLRATNGGGWHVQNYSSGSWANNIVCATSDAVTLYYNGNTKLDTINTGVNITGGIRVGGNNAANELDDYEEGTWTVADASGNSVSFTAEHTAQYTKIGRFVHVQFDVTVGSNSVGSHAHFTLPFTAVNYSGGVMNYGDYNAVIVVHVGGNGAYLFKGIDSNAGFSWSEMSTKRMIFGFTYQAA